MTATIVYRNGMQEDLFIGVGAVAVESPGGGTLVGNRVNLASFALTAQQTWAPAAVAAHGVATVAVSCPGARVGFPALCSFNGILGHQNRGLHAEVVTDESVMVFLTNNDASSSLSVGPGTLRVLCFPIPLL